MPPDLDEHAKLPEQWREHFPSTAEQARAWEPYIRYIALHMNVLIVAKSRIEIGWKAYCGPVSGMNHDNEWAPVAANGDAISETIARAMFPEFEGVRYAR